VAASKSIDVGRTTARAYPLWVRACGWVAIAAALPTVIWRALVGLGVDLGTPATWRHAEQLPGRGTSYVLSLSAIELAAALLTLVLILPHGDQLPPWHRSGRRSRLPTLLVAGCSAAGVVVLGFLCVASAVHWSNVDPFHAASSSYWAWLCWGCYAAAPLWPIMLAATTVGYSRARRRERQPPIGS
jgi:hypothetical protein